MLTPSQQKHENHIQGTLNTMLNKMQQLSDEQLPTVYHIYLQLITTMVQKAQEIQTNWHLVAKLHYEQYFQLVNRLATIIEGACCNLLLLKIFNYLVKNRIQLGDLGNYLEACHVSNKHMVEMQCEYLIVTDLIFEKIIEQSQSEKLEFHRTILIDKVQLAAVKSLQCKDKIDKILSVEGRQSLSPVFESNRHQEAYLQYRKYNETVKEFSKLRDALKGSTSSMERSLVQVIL